MIDPQRLLQLVEKYAVKVESGVVYRRYKRFRADRWYGGIATADVVGCNLRCGMCWAWRNTSFVLSSGEWLAPAEVAERLRGIAERRGFRQVRVSGGEPLIAPVHLLQVIDSFAKYTFIVETNGLLIDKALAKELAARPHAVVRVSIKGATAEEFVKITMSPPQYFYKQLEALRLLVEAGMEPCRDVYPAAMLGFSTAETARELEKALAKIDPRLADCIDVEYVILYPHVVKLMSARGLKPTKAVTPSGVPAFMI
ncbi:MAG: radical SAM protein [Pyrobaculum arsenaticum]|uniref:Radical SAM domain protein n=2 Tax=Pyrobaculum arsenaticum TaxID=121277 RepID=A4WL97_PYRAR|nr:radical SAM protein [Pyrobaculum arsenaticum]ABP51164.1 Radical SAM domain protein [Pyrobaculum arsenaticum DSM 13514]MCY0891600.1 radical SAM protein [Pyrobaculum arsenaticum]NYR15112.1 radical SAM protein [Pyrobaculum arsenaticum]